MYGSHKIILLPLNKAIQSQCFIDAYCPATVTTDSQGVNTNGLGPLNPSKQQLMFTCNASKATHACPCNQNIIGSYDQFDDNIVSKGFFCPGTNFI